MKHSLTGLAIAAILATPMVAQAESTVYGRIHMSVDQVTAPTAADKTKTATDTAVNGSAPRANTLGVRGSEDTSFMGMKAIYQFEIGLDTDRNTANTDPATGNTALNTKGKPDVQPGLYYQRDTWFGLQSDELGSLRAGTMATSYKQTGKLVDPFFTTALEGRGVGFQSGLHSGNGDGKGRQTRTVRYDSPSIAGAKIIVANNAVNNKEDNMNLGIHYGAGPIKAFVDHIILGKSVSKDKTGAAVAAADGTATKLGLQYAGGPVTVGFDYEMDGGALGGFKSSAANHTFVNVAYKMGMTDIALSYGMRDDSGAETGGVKKKDGQSGWGLGAIHSIAKKTALYAGYGTVTPNDSQVKETTIFTIGMNHAF
ncbi:MAG: porin [Gammaproteobacteria bacterium]|nr:porin [Gammaproteobacteria bacterium]